MIITGGYQELQDRSVVYVNATDFLWIYDAKAVEWTVVVPNGNTSFPCSRCAHGAALINNTVLMIYGGIDQGSVPLSDLWQLDGAMMLWSQPALVKSQSPGPRFEFAMVSLGSHVFVLYGLTGEETYPAEPVWAYEYESAVWYPITTAMGYSAPVSRSGLTATAVNDSFIVIFGGELFLSAHLGLTDNGIWIFSPDAPHPWAFVEPVNYPCVRLAHTAVVIRGDYMVIYGGMNFIDGFLGDVWLLEAVPWQTDSVWQQYPSLGAEHPVA
jgi:hypothetical protein